MDEYGYKEAYAELDDILNTFIVQLGAFAAGLGHSHPTVAGYLLDSVGDKPFGLLHQLMAVRNRLAKNDK